MTTEDPTVEIPDELEAEIPAPEVPPTRQVVIQMQFETTDPAIDTAVYAAKVDHPHGADPAGFAKGVAEIVERTTMLHLGALPVLTKQEVAA